MTSSLVRTTASSTMSAKPQPCRVSRTKARAVGDRAPDRVEGGGRPRRDHRTPRPVSTSRPEPSGSARAWFAAPVTRVVAGYSRWSWCGPVPARSWSCHRPAGRTGSGWTADARLLTFAARADAVAVIRPSVRTMCEAAELLWPGSARGETLGRLEDGLSTVRQFGQAWCDRAAPGTYGRPLREGHGGVWRSGAGHGHAPERRTVPCSKRRPMDGRRRHGGPEQAAGGPGVDAGRQLPQAADGVRATA